MSIESEILRIQHNIANAYAAVADKGGKVPLQPTSENLAAAVASISTDGDVYSLEERRIGTWIDGKPLYRKVFQGMNITQYGAWTVWRKNAIPDLEYAVRARTTYTRSTGFINCTFTNIISTEISKTGDILLFIANGATPFPGVPITVTVEYTKTTDEGSSEYDYYSLDERRIGTWIDGKPLYRRVFQGNNITKYGVWTVWRKDAIPGLEYVVETRTVYTKSDGFINCEFSDILSTEINKTGDISLFLEAGSTAYYDVPITVTVEYTKTTDQKTIDLPAVTTMEV